jgi:hypothetical protein
MFRVTRVHAPIGVTDATGVVSDEHFAAMGFIEGEFFDFKGGIRGV